MFALLGQQLAKVLDFVKNFPEINQVFFNVPTFRKRAFYADKQKILGNPLPASEICEPNKANNSLKFHIQPRKKYPIRIGNCRQW